MKVIIISIICLSCLVMFIKKLRKAIYTYNTEREKFVLYLDSINDVETLKKIGEINMFDQRERVYPAYYKVVNWLKTKIENEKDEHFIKFLESYEDFNVLYVVYMVIICISGYMLFIQIKSFF